MSTILSPIGNFQVEDENGDPAVGWKWYTYAAGTSTPLATYTTQLGNVEQANPIELNSLGFPEDGPIWLTRAVEYKLILTDEDDVVKATFDDVVGISDDLGVGKQTVWLPASAMNPTTTNGAARGLVELTTNDVMLNTLDFDATTSELAQFMMAMPKSWNEGTITAVPFWTAASGTGTAIWGVQAVAYSNDDALDSAFGTAQISTDTLLAANDLHIGPETPAITVGGTPAESDMICIQVYRDISDTLNADAKLIGLKVIFTIDAGSDD